MERDSRVGRLTALAGRQHGLVSWNQLHRLGFDKDAVSRLRARGWLHHLVRNVYAVGHTALAPPARLLAGVMTYGPAAHVSDVSAVAAYELFPPWESAASASVVHVTIPPGVRPARRPGTVAHRRQLARAETTRLGPIPIVTVERALRDFAIVAPQRRLERAVDQAVVARRTTPTNLWACVRSAAGVSGVPALRAVLENARRYASLTRSELEEALLCLTRATGLDDPHLNVRVPGIAGRLDAYWPEHRVGVEVDGWRWHLTGQRQHDDRTKELEARRVGVLLARYSARQVFETQLLMAGDLAATLARRTS